ncbi:MAG TPA: efflux RND transporter periplasmic adaptor subunit [Candidatus Eremiobacteraceae bacterium]|jgi:multidrug resistance efflux pump
MGDSRALRFSAFVVASIAVTLTSCGRSGVDFPYSGTVLRESAAVGSTLGGRVTSVPVASGDKVRAGQVIVTFDDAQQRAAVAAAQAQTRAAEATFQDALAGPRPSDIARADAQAAQAQAELEQLRLSGGPRTASALAQVRASAAGLAQAQADAGLASRTAQRQRELYARGAVALQSADNADAAARAAIASVATARALLHAAQAQAASVQHAEVPQQTQAALEAYAAAAAQAATIRAGTRPDQLQSLRAQVLAARADLALAEARFAECTVRAPGDGVVSSFDLHRGDLVAPGASVATIDEFLDPYVRIYVRQADLARFASGVAVHVRSDAVPGKTFDGKVAQVDTIAQFTPRDVQTPEDRADLTFGVKVRIHDPDGALRGGTTASVAVP